MCYSAYIGTNQKINLDKWNIEGLFTINNISVEEYKEVKNKIENQYIYSLSSYEGCACGFSEDEDLFEDLSTIPKDVGIDIQKLKKQNEVKIQSINLLLEFIKYLSQKEKVVFYSCWYDELHLPLKDIIEIDINHIDIKTNYFGLEERRKIIFNSSYH